MLCMILAFWTYPSTLNVIDPYTLSRLEGLKEVKLLGNPWKCSCLNRFRAMTEFLLKNEIIPCCPKSCECKSNTESKSIQVMCNSKRLSFLPSCLPYEKIDVDFSNNLLENLSFAPQMENITSLQLQGNRITEINGTSLELLKNVSFIDLRNNLLEEVPPELESLRYTKTFLEGNEFQCKK